ncbi:MAG: nitroreductase family protein [Candidatus Omnitrophica bacterium]|nr:nitroreductase family protein [Candidatus Omnitrophota bacterium]
MDVFEAIKKRRTIRRFKPDQVPLPVLQKLVEAARFAPSGGNLQPWEFIIVNDPGLLPDIFATLAWAGYIAPAGNPPEGKRPTAYIVALQNTAINPRTPVADLAAAIENILLQAVEEGLGTCWIGSVRREKLAEILSLPEGYVIDSVVALGYPDEKAVIEPYQGSVKYWRDEDGVFHVPKRSLAEIVHYNRFQKRG